MKVKIEGERAMLLDRESDPKTGLIDLDLPLGNVYEVFVDKKNCDGTSK